MPHPTHLHPPPRARAEKLRPHERSMVLWSLAVDNTSGWGGLKGEIMKKVGNGAWERGADREGGREERRR